MVDKTLLGRMIDFLGVVAAIAAHYKYGPPPDDCVQDIPKAKSAEWVLGADGRTRLRRAAEAHHEAASLLKHLLTTEKPRLTAGRRRLLRAYLLFVGSEFGLDHVALALVHEADALRSVLGWYWDSGDPLPTASISTCRLGRRYWF